MYVYLGEDREAGNVYTVGPALVALRALTAGRALQVAHHFTKAAASKLTLASLTQAGMREAVDHWLLISVEEHDLAAQRFMLDMERGARRGLAWSRRAEIILGPFDHDTLRHPGHRRSPGWHAATRVEQAEGPGLRRTPSKPSNAKTPPAPSDTRRSGRCPAAQMNITGEPTPRRPRHDPRHRATHQSASHSFSAQLCAHVAGHPTPPEARCPGPPTPHDRPSTTADVHTDHTDQHTTNTTSEVGAICVA